MQKDWMDDDETVIDEAALVTHFKAGTMSNAELRFLTRRLTNFVRGNYSALFGEADLIASQTILQAFRYIGALQDLSSFYGWAIVIASRLAVKRCKELQRLPTQSRDAAPVHTNIESPEEAQALWKQTGFNDDKLLRRMALKEAFLSLTEEQQQVLFWRFFGQHPLKEIAMMIDKKDDATRQIESRACRKMRDFLVTHGYADLFISEAEVRKLRTRAGSTTRSASLAAIS